MEQYAVMVDGKNSPSKLHDSYKSAMDEAERLCLSEKKTAFVMKVIAKIDLSKVTVTEFKEHNAGDR